MAQLITKLATDPNFAVSDIHKMPLNVGKYLTTRDTADIQPVKSSDMDHLPTLNEIDACPDFAKTNRAYHLHAATNLVIGFDIEPRCDQKYLAYFATLPAHYREYSMHNGIHLLYQLDRKKISSQATQMLAQRTEYKFKDIVNQLPLEYELMMNKHWLTLTRRTFGQQNDLATPVPQVIYDLINHIALDWQLSSHNEAQVNLSKTASKTAHAIADMIDYDKIAALQEYTLADFNNDDSKYEYNIAIRIAGMINNRLYHAPKPFDAIYLGCDPALVSKDNFIWATALLLEKSVPPRDKDKQKRDGLPWLVYVAKQACTYILNNN